MTRLLFLAAVPAMAAVSVSMAPDAGWSAVRGSASPDAKVTRLDKPSLRVEPGPGGAEARVRSPKVNLTVGKTYEVKGWIRTEGLEVRDSGRSPIAVGASLAMASMPFDVHSETLGGTREWRQVSLRFVATRAQDQIEIRAAEGGQFKGKFWVDGVGIDEVSTAGSWPAKEAVETFGPAYRYPIGGWIYLHIEGDPYDRGFQHGYLLAREIEGYVDRCASQLDSKSKSRAWENGRSTADAIFLRGFDDEIRQEMKGIADGAAAAKAKYDGRAIDLRDIVAANTITELGLLSPANEITPTGLEGLHLRLPEYYDPKRDVGVTQRCSAFAATGKATRDGRMVIGHITMWPLTLAEQTNVMLDIKPAQGHRVLMQAYPGGIQSGTDYYQNDQGVVLTETTIRQSPFNVQGTPVAFRARKAIQYGTTIDLVVQHLSGRNNGLYTNEWLIGDAKNDEIAMYELGTNQTRLYRSSKGDWFGGTEGFFWGCNNAKDIKVRSEYTPDPRQAPQDIPFVPSARDRKWLELYDTHKGKIDENFAFLAFRTAPLVSATSFDAKVTTSEMASRYMVWAVLGKPNQREWLPNARQLEQYPGNEGIHSSGYRLISGEASETLRTFVHERETVRLAQPPAKEETKKPSAWTGLPEEKLWKGWFIPASDGDRWLPAAGEAYYSLLQEKDLDEELDSWRIRYRAATRKTEVPLRQTTFQLRDPDWFEAARAKGTLLLDSLRRRMGDDKFLALMKSFYAEHTTGSASTAQFVAAASQTNGAALDDFFAEWLDRPGLPGDPGGPVYSIQHIGSRLAETLIVYGTVTDAGSNRYAAEQLRRQLNDWFEQEIRIVKDFELTPDDAKANSLILVGRPETNSVLRELAPRLGLRYEAAAFERSGKTYAHENDGLVMSAQHPDDAQRMVVVVAGNSALQTVRLSKWKPTGEAWQQYRGPNKVDK